MKKFTRLLALSLLVVMAVSMLVSCGSTYGKIEKNLEEIGYAKTEEKNALLDAILGEVSDGTLSATTHIFKKNTISWAVVLEFKAEGDIDEAFADSETLKGLLDDAQKSDLVNGNCVLVPFTLDPNELIEAFKK